MKSAGHNRLLILSSRMTAPPAQLLADPNTDKQQIWVDYIPPTMTEIWMELLL